MSEITYNTPMYRLALALVAVSGLCTFALGCSDKKDAPTEPQPKTAETHKGIEVLPIKVDAEPARAKEPSPCYAEDQGPGAADLKQGKAHSVARDMEEARSSLTRAIALDPKNPLAHFELGKVHNSLGKPKDAAGEFRLATELAQSCDDYAWIPEAYRLLGYAIRESDFSERSICDAWANYMDRMQVRDRKFLEVQKLMIPMRCFRGRDRNERD